jgi:hypothetical protein
VGTFFKQEGRESIDVSCILVTLRAFEESVVWCTLHYAIHESRVSGDLSVAVDSL